MPILAALVVSSVLAATPAVPSDGSTAEPTPTVPAASHDDLSFWRPPVIALGVVGGLTGGFIVGYQLGVNQYNGSSSGLDVSFSGLSGFSWGVAGGLLGGVAGGVLAGMLTSSWSNAPGRSVTLVPTAGGRETAGLHLLMTF